MSSLLEWVAFWVLESLVRCVIGTTVQRRRGGAEKLDCALAHFDSHLLVLMSPWPWSFWQSPTQSPNEKPATRI